MLYDYWERQWWSHNPNPALFQLWRHSWFKINHFFRNELFHQIVLPLFQFFSDPTVLRHSFFPLWSYMNLLLSCSVTRTEPFVPSFLVLLTSQELPFPPTTSPVAMPTLQAFEKRESRMTPFVSKVQPFFCCCFSCPSVSTHNFFNCLAILLTFFGNKISKEKKKKIERKKKEKKIPSESKEEIFEK